MQLIANHSNTIEQRANPGNRFGLEEDFRVSYVENEPFEIPDNIGQEYLRTFPTRFKLASEGKFVIAEEVQPVKPVEVVKEPEAIENDPELKGDATLVNTENPPTPEEVLEFAESDPEKVFAIAESLEIKFPKNIGPKTLAEKVNAKIAELSSK